jgi:hypothetical protein
MENLPNRELDIKIGTPEQVKWQEVLDAQRNNLVSARVIQQQAEVIIALCEKRIKEEKRKTEKNA